MPAKVLTSLALIVPLLAHAFHQPAEQPSRSALSREPVAITNVDVVTMTNDRLVTNATVLVRDGRIAEMGPATSVNVPAGVRRIDGRGKFLMPGLADMHTHLYSDEEVHDSVAPYELGVMLARGVTAARLMIGTPEHFALRRDIEAGRFAGPQLWIASPQFTGRQDVNSRVVATVADARVAVREAKAAGYDFIKLTLFITPEIFDAIVDEGRKAGIKIVGHVDPQVGVARALAAGQQIEHLDNYFESILADTSPIRVSVSDRYAFQPANWQSLDFVDDAKVERIAGATARAGVYSTPTLSFFKNTFGVHLSDDEIRALPDWNMIPPSVKTLYMGARQRLWSNPPSEARRKRYVQVRERLVKAIVDSGGRIMAGSDAPGWLMSYGWGLHRELEAFVTAGLTPFQALQTATVNPAAFLGASAEWGTLERGKRADMVLLAGNPLADIRNTARIDAVILGGKVIESATLEKMIRDASVRVSGPGQ